MATTKGTFALVRPPWGGGRGRTRPGNEAKIPLSKLVGDALSTRGRRGATGRRERQVSTEEQLIEPIGGWVVMAVMTELVVGAFMLVAADSPGYWLDLLGAVISGVALTVFGCGFYIVRPDEARVLVSAGGSYLGTVRRNGLAWTLPTVTKERVSLGAHDHCSEVLSVTGAGGTPVEVGAVVTWQVVDTARAVFDVEDYEVFLHGQTEGAARQVAGGYRGDGHGDSQPPTRADAGPVATALRAELQERLEPAGIAVIEATLRRPARLPEIAFPRAAPQAGRLGGATLAEDLFLVLLDPRSGRLPLRAGVGLYGALLAELVLKDRVVDHDGCLVVVDRSPTADSILDEAFGALDGSARRRKAGYWVGHLSRHVPDLDDRLAERLVADGIVRVEERRGGLFRDRVLGVSYRLENPLARQRLTNGLLDALFAPDGGDLRSRTLLELLSPLIGGYPRVGPWGRGAVRKRLQALDHLPTPARSIISAVTHEARKDLED